MTTSEPTAVTLARLVAGLLLGGFIVLVVFAYLLTRGTRLEALTFIIIVILCLLLYTVIA